jgi:hypothetical protein
MIYIRDLSYWFLLAGGLNSSIFFEEMIRNGNSHLTKMRTFVELFEIKL